MQKEKNLKNNNMYKEYRKTATVKAKLFEEGDQHGYDMYNNKRTPYIKTMESQMHFGDFGEHYICVGIQGEKWLVYKDIFEKTYEPVTN
jgi:hypothetical protein